MKIPVIAIYEQGCKSNTEFNDRVESALKYLQVLVIYNHVDSTFRQYYRDSAPQSIRILENEF